MPQAGKVLLAPERIAVPQEDAAVKRGVSFAVRRSMEGLVSATGIMTTSRKVGGGTRETKPAIKRRSFWRGVLEGFSGPALMASQPKLINSMVEVTGDRIRLKLPRGHRSSYTFKTREEAMAVARALSKATDAVMAQHGLVIGQESFKRLDHEGKLRQIKRLQVKRHAEDASK